jgi:hypothetical protein
MQLMLLPVSKKAQDKLNVIHLPEGLVHNSSIGRRAAGELFRLRFWNVPQAAKSWVLRKLYAELVERSIIDRISHFLRFKLCASTVKALEHQLLQPLCFFRCSSRLLQ